MLKSVIWNVKLAHKICRVIDSDVIQFVKIVIFFSYYPLTLDDKNVHLLKSRL